MLTYVPSLNLLTPSFVRSAVDVRILSLWMLDNSEESSEQFGLNMKLLDQKENSIEAYINPRLVRKFQPLLHQGEMYSLSNFTVAVYTQHMTQRASTNPYYILLREESEIQKIHVDDRAIPRYAFDFVLFKHIRHIKQDNNILIDIVGLIGFVEPPCVVINEQGHEEKSVEFGITDGIQIFQVILRDNICEQFLDTMSELNDQFSVIILQSCRLLIECGVYTFTNHPATRFATNSDISIVQHLANKLFSLGQSKSDKLYSICYVAELNNVTEKQLQESPVICRLRIKSIDVSQKWYACICTECGVEVEENIGNSHCLHCKSKIIMPDKRYRILAHCFDISGELFICIGHTEIHNIVGKSVFEMLQIQNFHNDVPLFIRNIVNSEMIVEVNIGTWATHNGLLKFDASQILLLDQQSLRHRMAFEKFDPLAAVDPGRYNWRVKVRISRKWESIQKNTGNIKGCNIILVDDQPPRHFVNKNNEEQSYVKFDITDGSHCVKVTLWDGFGHKFYDDYTQFKEDPIILILSSCKANVWEKILSLSNYPATRYFFNYSHHSVNMLRASYKQPGFRTTQVEMNRFEPDPKMTVAEVKNTIPDMDEMKVVCTVTINKITNQEIWFYHICCGCSNEIEKIDGKFRCDHCQKTEPYPDTRFRVCTLASDHTGTIGIILYDREVRRVIGHSVFEIECMQIQIECPSPTSGGDTYIKEQPSVSEGTVTQTSKQRGKNTPDTLRSTNKPKGKKKLVKKVRMVNLANDEDEDNEDIPLGMWNTQTDPE
ncbi:hypothetical protein DCAR_0623461 [Daucus carota subsp. sativus]|uniref:Uncharacterized protein n=1 Tax=Daucus carota subsp. sativus TaxID=79200 RepID=A0A175YDT6_DAUCS|nr:hypothetical protein DCAR_0623461 [Daucus carota subsp. sativus]